MKRKFDRVYHKYTSWEEIAHGMWDDGGDHLLQCAVELTGNHVLYGMYMRRVVSEWPMSSENALTDPNINQKAWVGHAAVAMAIQCPEHITRKAWSFLTDEQQFLANREAEGAIREWRLHYAKDREVRKDVGGSLL